MSDMTIEYTASSLAAIANLFDEKASDLDKRLKMGGFLRKKDEAEMKTQAEIWRQAADILRETTIVPSDASR